MLKVVLCDGNGSNLCIQQENSNLKLTVYLDPDVTSEVDSRTVAVDRFQLNRAIAFVMGDDLPEAPEGVPALVSKTEKVTLSEGY
jgi:hypothetical protein